MGKLIQLENEDLLAEGADPRQLWRAVKELYETINDITVTINPSKAGHAEYSEGDIQLCLQVITLADAPNVIPGYAPPGSAVTDDSGGSN